MTFRNWIANQRKKLKAKDSLSKLLSLTAVIPLFFLIPIVLLYAWAPLTFQLDWKGRFPYFIFVWLLFLEIFLAWHKLAQSSVIDLVKQRSLRFFLGLACLFVPILLVLWEFLGAGSTAIISLGQLLGAPGAFAPNDWIYAFESVFFAFFFTLSVLLLEKRSGLRHFSVSLFFIGAVSTFYVVDAFFPLGIVWFFQLLVPPIVSMASLFFNILGYPTYTSALADGYFLGITSSSGQAMNLLVYWTCAGVNSMIIYTVVISLFLRNFEISLKKKILYAVLGAAGTFVANIARIVSIGIIGIQNGSNNALIFHEYYGELFFIAWMIIYLAAVFFASNSILSLKPQKNILNLTIRLK